MYHNQKLVFSRRLTAAEVKKIESLVEDVPGIFVTDVKTHSVELLVDVDDINVYNGFVTEVYKELKIKNAIPLPGQGYLLVWGSNTSLQSADMKNHMADKAKDLF